jgi:hypothetical protein
MTKKVFYRPQPWTDEGRIEVGSLSAESRRLHFTKTSNLEEHCKHLRVEDIAVIRIAVEDLEQYFFRGAMLPSSIGPHFILE